MYWTTNIERLWQYEQERNIVRNTVDNHSLKTLRSKMDCDLIFPLWWERKSFWGRFSWSWTTNCSSPPSKSLFMRVVEKNEPKVNSFNSNYFKLEMFLYERPSLQRAISLHMSTTNQPEWTLIICQKSFLGEKLKVNNLPIFDLTKYSFVVRSK